MKPEVNYKGISKKVIDLAPSLKTNFVYPFVGKWTQHYLDNGYDLSEIHAEVTAEVVKQLNKVEIRVSVYNQHTNCKDITAYYPNFDRFKDKKFNSDQQEILNLIQQA